MILKLNTISWIVILDLSPRCSIASCEGVGEVEYQAEYCANAAKLGHTGSLATYFNKTKNLPFII